MFYLFQVSVGQNSALGKGPNKKDAKRNAAENLLVEMGYESELKRRSVKNNDLPLVNSNVMMIHVFMPQTISYY